LVATDWMRGGRVAVASVPVKATSMQVKLRKGQIRCGWRC
jgi:hypothetical protein